MWYYKIMGNIFTRRLCEIINYKQFCLKVKKIFHGGCLSCKTPEKKGIGTCTGCQYLMGWDYPDLSTSSKNAV